MNIVAVGGGTGISTLLKGLKYFDDIDLSAIITVTDEGGSSGVIRNEYSVPPPGDVRNNLVALARDEEILGKLFNFRFSDGFLSGHTVGNIIITALTKITGSFAKAIEYVSQVLAIKGKVIPVSEDLIRIVVEYDDGTRAFGERQIQEIKCKKIENIYLDKKGVIISGDAKHALQTADCIIFGPGSLYTSILSNVVVDGFVETLKSNKNAIVIYISNIMTQASESYKFLLSDHVNVVEKYIKRKFDFIVVNDAEIPEDILRSYREEMSEPVKVDLDEKRIIKENLFEIIVDKDGREKIRHNPLKLASVIMNIIR
ncbi:MAG: YvcK family protein [Thermosipho sp. (in: Bacteria)]|nr:YvcK family protein [Thermosipho sp. (in: thermotogales)]